jgi:hypothetical protein
MFCKLRSRLTYANTVSTLCLFVVLGGGAYAATQLPENSVGTKQLKVHAVTPPKLSKTSTAFITRSAGRAKSYSIKAVNPGVHGDFGTFYGVKASWACGNYVTLRLSPVAAPTLRFFGWIANNDGAGYWYKEIPTPEFPGFPGMFGDKSGSIDVLASLVPNGKATHFILGGQRDPDTHRCSFYGQIVPSS